MTGHKNRRQATRAPVFMAVKKSVGARVYLCQASDISADGVFLANVLDELHPHGAKCLLEFTLPGSEVTISARGQVIRQSANGRYHLSAVRFSTIAPSHRRLIHRYVRGAPRDLATGRPVFLDPL